MNLKEAFHYQNYLGDLIHQATNYLDDPSNIIIATQYHNKSAANPAAEDEVREVINERRMHASAGDLLKFINAVMEEKAFLTRVIHEAKIRYPFMMDAELANNRLRQNIANTLERMGAVKTGDRLRTGQSYAFNAEGNQMPYAYEIREEVKLDFDKAELRSMIKSIRKECDRVSAESDKMLVELEIEFDPIFDINDSFEDTVADFVAKL